MQGDETMSGVKMFNVKSTKNEYMAENIRFSQRLLLHSSCLLLLSAISAGRLGNRKNKEMLEETAMLIE